MRDAERLLQRLDWTVLRRLDGLLQGDYRTLFRGAGLDLAELREYQLSDDARYIDWNVTARMDTPYVRQYLEDRDLTAWFLLDLSPSMDFGGTEKLKKTILVEFVTVLARLLTRRGNRVGAVLFSGEVDAVIPPGSGKLHALRLIDRLLQPPPQRNTTTDLSRLLIPAMGLIRRRSLLFIVSDFISAPGWERPLGILARRHELLAARLVDPSETELPDVGLLLMQDAETGEQLYVDTHDRKFRERFHAAALRREQELHAMLARAGVDTLELSTEGDLASTLVAYAALRKRRKSLPSSAGSLSRAGSVALEVA